MGKTASIEITVPFKHRLRVMSALVESDKFSVVRLSTSGRVAINKAHLPEPMDGLAKIELIDDSDVPCSRPHSGP
jgi:hypothetical protein